MLPALSPPGKENTSHRRTDSLRARAATQPALHRKNSGLHRDEQAEVVQSLCKTYEHATQKLLYAFSALNEQSQHEDGSRNISQALATSARGALLEHLSATLAAGVEKVLRAP